MIHPTALIYPNVHLGRDVTIDAFVILGQPPRGKKPGELETHIGDGSVILSHTVIYAGNRIGRNLQTGHGVLLREGNVVGDDVSIGSHSTVEHHVSIGHGVRLHSHVFVPEFSVLEDEAWLGPNVVLTNTRYPLSHGAKNTMRGPTIRGGAKVGANSTVLPAVVIGRNALVGAGSVVVRDVAANKVVAGVPARIIRDIAQIDVYAASPRDVARKRRSASREVRGGHPAR